MPPRRAKAKPAEEQNPDALRHPKLHADLINHARTLQLVEESFSNGRPAHGWLLTGPQGIGKATFAYSLARRLLSIRDKAEGLPPPVASTDPVARRIAEGSHSDFKALEPEGAANIINVDAIREVSQFFQLTAAESAWRVVIIDPAESLNINAANALLKILEEPPEHALLMLVSHMPGKLLPTIRSRCRTVHFTPPDDTAFTQIIETSGKDISASDLNALHMLAQGSPGVALALHEGNALPLYKAMLDALANYPQIALSPLLALGDMAGMKGQDNSWAIFKRLFSHLQHRIIESAAHAQASNDGAADIHTEALPGENAIIQRIAAVQPLAFWLDVWENTTRIIGDADRLYLDRKHVILDCFNRMFSSPS